MDKKENIRNLMREILDFSKGGSDFWEKKKGNKGEKKEGKRKSQGTRRDSELLSKEGVTIENGKKSNLSFWRPAEFQSINMNCMYLKFLSSKVVYSNIWWWKETRLWVVNMKETIQMLYYNVVYLKFV